MRAHHDFVTDDSFGSKATVDVVSCPTFDLGLPAYYILALSEASRCATTRAVTFCFFLFNSFLPPQQFGKI